MRLTRDSALAEDLLHQAFERFLKEREKKHIPDDRLRAVLFRLAYQAFVEWRRKEMSEQRKTDALIALRPPANREEELVERVFDEATGPRSTLSAQQRGILLLRVRCALSVEDVCLALSISRSTYHRCMKSAEDELKDMLARVRAEEGNSP